MNGSKSLIIIVILLVVGVIGWYAMRPVPNPADMMLDQNNEDTVMNETLDGSSTSGIDIVIQPGASEDSSDSNGADSVAPVASSGSYEEYSPEKIALAESGDVILFFHAQWCPTCRSIESEIMERGMLPEGVHILKVNFDTAISLRQMYGVTVQHTFVQVDHAGNLISKYSDATKLDQVIERIQ